MAHSMMLVLPTRPTTFVDATSFLTSAAFCPGFVCSVSMVYWIRRPRMPPLLLTQSKYAFAMLGMSVKSVPGCLVAMAPSLITGPVAFLPVPRPHTLFVFVCYHAAGVWRRGIIGHPVKVLKGHVAFLAPINLVEEFAKPISLSLRLFGNIFAGGILVALIALFPPWIMWAPNAIWKSFDLFVGAIQAFIFALLTILYFSQSMELEEDHH